MHCDKTGKLPGGIKVNISIQGQIGEVSIFIRPHIQECLHKLKEHYEIVLFTASIKDYADAILKYIDPEDTIFDYKLYREHCIEYYNSYMVKDLRIIRNRNLKDMVLVDNSAISFLSQLSNGIPIIPYSDSKDDDELLDLTRYLLSIKDNYDLRIHNKKTF